MNADTTTSINHDTPRRSACAARSREQEINRLRRLSVEQRMRAALTMQNKFAGLKPAKAG